MTIYNYVSPLHTRTEKDTLNFPGPIGTEDLNTLNIPSLFDAFFQSPKSYLFSFFLFFPLTLSLPPDCHSMHTHHIVIKRDNDCTICKCNQDCVG